jgi:hypothetical protein
VERKRSVTGLKDLTGSIAAMGLLSTKFIYEGLHPENRKNVLEALANIAKWRGNSAAAESAAAEKMAP